MFLFLHQMIHLHVQWSLHFDYQPSARKYGLKLKVVLKWRDIYVENIRKMLLIAGLKIEEIVKCGEGVLSCRDHCISIL